MFVLSPRFPFHSFSLVANSTHARTLSTNTYSTTFLHLDIVPGNAAATELITAAGTAGRDDVVQFGVS